MGRVAIGPVNSQKDLDGVVAQLQSLLNDLQDQINGRPSLFAITDGKVPTSKKGDVIFSTNGLQVDTIKVKIGKDTYADAPLASTVTLDSLGVNPGAAAQITSGPISQASLGISQSSIGISSGAEAQITAGAITLSTLGVNASAATQITSGPITLLSLGVNSSAATQIQSGPITLLSLGVNSSAATQIQSGPITRTSIGIVTGYATQIAGGGVIAGQPVCAPAQIESGHSTLRFRGYTSGTNSALFLTDDGDWGFFLYTTPTPDELYVMLRLGSVIYGALMT